MNTLNTHHVVKFSSEGCDVFGWLDGEQVYLCAMPTEEAAAAKVQELRKAMKNGTQGEHTEYRRIFES